MTNAHMHDDDLVHPHWAVAPYQGTAKPKGWDPDAIAPGSLRGGAQWDVYRRERQACDRMALISVLCLGLFLGGLMVWGALLNGSHIG